MKIFEKLKTVCFDGDLSIIASSDVPLSRLCDFDINKDMELSQHTCNVFFT